MSRVGNKPIQIPEKTSVDIKDGNITIKGAKGVLNRVLNPLIDVKVEEGRINCYMTQQDKKTHALQGMMRALIANMVTGVSKGFERVLEINGIGYRAEVKGNQIEFNVGYSSPVMFNLPDGISASIEKNQVKLVGIDKELVGLTAAKIRQIRKPEPYKGKGIKYIEEYIQRKAGKAGSK